MSTWHANIGFTIDPVLDDDSAFDLLDALADYGAAMSVSQDYAEATVTMTVDATRAIDAISKATDLIRAAAPGSIDPFEVRAVTPEVLDAELAEPLFPEVVGYAEIAKRAGVSRQRASQFPKTTGFPSPVIETTQGPLFNVHAVERWLETRNTTSGRRKAATPA